MEHFVDENVVMRFYLDRMAADEIGFLKGKTEVKEQVKDMIWELLMSKKMNDRIAVATKLWKVLFEAAMSSIDRDKQGYDKLFNYFDEYVEFEELIFASDSFYRDHTLHCMWVYFLGEYVAHTEEFDCLFEEDRKDFKLQNAMEELLHMLEMDETEQMHCLKFTNKAANDFRGKQDAIRCVTALTHDLGYPLKKVEKINKSIRKILPFYSVESFGDFKFEYGNVNQHFIEEFMNLLSTEVAVSINGNDIVVGNLMNDILLNTAEDKHRINGINMERVNALTEEEKQRIKEKLQIVIWSKKRLESETRIFNDFESYQHGIMSAFLLAKNVQAFRNLKIDLEQVKNITDWEDYADYLCKFFVLNAITMHTCDAFKIKMIDDTSFLTFIDELEEFSRISRASQSREYVEEFCSSQIYMEDGWFTVNFTFDNDELDNLDPEKGIQGTLQAFPDTFDIPKLDENLKIRLRCIGKLKKNQSTYQLEIAKKHVKIFVDEAEQSIPKFLKSTQFYTSEEYAQM